MAAPKKRRSLTVRRRRKAGLYAGTKFTKMQNILFCRKCRMSYISHFTCKCL